MSGSERFARHALIPGWDQERLARATVVIVGAGALGNGVAQSLALAGVGRLVICDPDVVAASNLSRAPLFRPADVGQPKVEAVARALRELAPSTMVDARRAPFVSGVGLAELRDSSLVMGCLDSRASRLSLAGRASLVRARWIDGATAPWSGEVRPFLDPDGPCFGCAFSPAERAVGDTPWSCMEPRLGEPMGASVATSALVGSWMSVLALRALLGQPVSPETLVIDAATGRTSRVSRVRADDCPFHTAISAEERVFLGPRPTVGDILDALGPGREPLAWAPVLEKLECRRGHFAHPVWGPPRTEPCPVCGLELRARTTLELGRAPRELALADLGVAPREILAVREATSIVHVEICESHPPP